MCHEAIFGRRGEFDQLAREILRRPRCADSQIADQLMTPAQPQSSIDSAQRPGAKGRCLSSRGWYSLIYCFDWYSARTMMRAGGHAERRELG
jgi:hypothetical protein